ncbi:hypothetical protein ACG0Z6_06120 [Roseateles sp. BYS180W]|uniref:PEP-CTERM sorting domain-containing protein n=1 Tax=Roseateles rivi TaxID=3299028 RepID=A0ABW7FU30_9BURK
MAIRTHKITACLWVLLCTLPLHSQAQQLLDLGANFWASSVSADGRTVVGDNRMGAGYQMWRAETGLVNIAGTISAGQQFVGRASVSADGTRVSGTGMAGDGNTEAAWRSDSGTWSTLGGVGATSGTNRSSAWALSANGQYVGGMAWQPDGTTSGTVWRTGDGALATQVTISGTSVRLNALSNDARSLGGFQNGTMGREAYIWRDALGTGSFAGTAVGNDAVSASEVSAMTADGQWAVGVGNQLWRWSATGGTQALGRMGSGMGTSLATGVSADGSLIIGFERAFGSTAAQSFIWRDGVGLQSFNDYVHGNLGLDSARQFVFDRPMSVSADGQFVVGYASTTLNGGEAHGFLIQLTPVPEPASWALWLIGSLGLLRMGRRRNS